MGKGYSEAGASYTRRALKSFLPRSGSPREDIDLNNLTLRQRGRLLYMSLPVATSAINTNRTKVVGLGLTLKSAIDREILGLGVDEAKLWQQKTEAEFRLWASKKENCDATGVNNFEGLQQLALKSWLMSGDVFALLKRYEPTPTNPYSLRIHLIEADRVSTPSNSRMKPAYGPTEGEYKETGNKIYDGVEVDKNGNIVAYHICNVYPNEIATDLTTAWKRVEAFGKKTRLPQVLHIMEAERPEQYRGVTYLAQVIEPLLQLRRYTEAELMAALVQSFFTAWIETSSDTSEIPMNEVGIGDTAPGEADSQNLSRSDNEYEMGPGTILHLEEGEKVVFGNPNIPSLSFEGFTKTICRMIGAALEIPYDVLLKEFDASYSASRAALMEAWDAFRMRRQWFVDDFCQPVYEVWLAEAVARGRIKAPGFFDDPLVRAAWCGARWIGPVQGQIDPTKEAKAAIMLVDRGFKTHEQITREIGGGDWEANMEQLAKENELLKAGGGGNYMATIADNESAEGGETV